jgi:sugar phosphate isomerase/epimerase
MIELAVITDEIDNDLAHALDVMAEYGVHNAELRAIGDKNISAMTLEEVESVRRLLDSKGARAIGVASPFFKTDLPETGAGVTGPLHGAADLGFDAQIALLKHCFEIARILGAPYVRTFTFWKHGALTPAVEDAIVAAYAAPAKLAEEVGLTLLVENEHACYTGTGDETARIVRRIASPNVKIVWDPGNAIFAGETPFPDGYNAVKPYLAHVHVKDARPNPESGAMEWVVVGDGLADWPAQVRALRSDGYDGYLSLETHYTGGGDKESSSRACLEALKGIAEAG